MMPSSLVFRHWCWFKLVTDHSLDRLKSVSLMIFGAGHAGGPMAIALTTNFRAKGSGQVHQN